MRTFLSRQGLLTALAASIFLFAAGAVVGYTSITPQWARASLGAVEQTALFGSSFSAIFLQNISVALFLFSGVLTLGLTSVVCLALMSIYVGATMSVATTNGGVAAVLADTGSYIGLEFAGLVLAATAGLCPVLALLGRALRAETGPSRTSAGVYVGAVRTSMAALGASALLILLAAGIEAAVIASR